MDPLSITAAVVGLTTAAIQGSHILSSVTSKTKDAPKSAVQALREVNDFSTAITAIKGLIMSLEAAQKDRVSMIELEPVIATMTEAVLTFSEFQRVLSQLKCDSSLDFKAKFKWARTESTLHDLTQSICRHKVSLSLMLNVIQCQSNLDAELSAQRLHNQFEQLLRESPDMRERFKRAEKPTGVGIICSSDRHPHVDSVNSDGNEQSNGTVTKGDIGELAGLNSLPKPSFSLEILSASSSPMNGTDIAQSHANRQKEINKLMAIESGYRNAAMQRELLLRGPLGRVIASELDTTESIFQQLQSTSRSIEGVNANPSELDRALAVYTPQSHLEGVLEASRVYRRVFSDENDISFRTSIARTHAWSVFSGISLSDISNISVIALPLYPEEIAEFQEITRAGKISPSMPYSGALTFSVEYQSQRAQTRTQLGLESRKSLLYGSVPAWISRTHSRNSRASGSSQGRSIRTQQISAPLLSSNSLGWN